MIYLEWLCFKINKDFFGFLMNSAKQVNMRKTKTTRRSSVFRAEVTRKFVLISVFVSTDVSLNEGNDKIDGIAIF